MIDAEIKGKKYQLEFTMRSCKRIEKEAKAPVTVFLFKQGGVSDALLLLWACLAKHHPDVTQEQIEDWFTPADYYTDLKKVGEYVTLAIDESGLVDAINAEMERFKDARVDEVDAGNSTAPEVGTT